MKRKTWILCIATMFLGMFGAAESVHAQQSEEVEPRYTYHETDGLFLFYETDQSEAYRSLLPDVFDMPDRLLVQTFISDFYKMDARTEPYKEGAVFLLALYDGNEVWHCITMPVTSNESRLGGILRLGLPKIMGEIELTRDDPRYSGSVTVEGGHQMALQLDTEDYMIGEDREQLLKELTVIPKLNIRRGEVIEMTTSGSRGPRSVIDIATMFPRRMTLRFGEGQVSFTSSERNGDSGSTVHPFTDLTPTKILGSFYLKNTFTYKLGVKRGSAAPA